MGRLTTHVLDTALGRPGAGIRVQVYALSDTAERQLCNTATTNADGRCDAPLLEGADFKAGVYEVHFEAGDYLTSVGVASDAQRFLDVVVIRFGVADASEHYHVPLLLSPYGYSTYRGS